MILVDSAELLRELSVIIDAATAGMGREGLRADIMKQSYWRGEMCAAESIRLWVQGKIDRVPGTFKKVATTEVTAVRRTHADHCCPKD